MGPVPVAPNVGKVGNVAVGPDINLISNVPYKLNVNEPKKISLYAPSAELWETAEKPGGVKLYMAGKGADPRIPGTGYHNCAGVRGVVGINTGTAGICEKVDGGTK